MARGVWRSGNGLVEMLAACACNKGVPLSVCLSGNAGDAGLVTFSRFALALALSLTLSLLPSLSASDQISDWLVLPAMVNAPAAAASHASTPLTFFVPSPLHPAAYERCSELGVDVLLPSDERSKTWWDCERVRQLSVVLDYADAGRPPLLTCGRCGRHCAEAIFCRREGGPAPRKEAQDCRSDRCS